MTLGMLLWGLASARVFRVYVRAHTVTGVSSSRELTCVWYGMVWYGMVW